MKKVVALSFFLTLTFAVAAPVAHLRKCSELVSGGLSVADSFILLASRKLAEDKHLPRSGPATYRLLRINSSGPSPKSGEMEAAFATVLAAYKMTPAEWKLVEEVHFENTMIGSEGFLKELPKVRLEKKKLSPDQLAALKKLNTAAEAAREKLVMLLSSAEHLSFAQSNRLLTEEELLASIHRFSRDTKLKLAYLGVANLEEWRYRLFTEREKLRDNIEKAIIGAFLQVVSLTSEIHESSEQILSHVSEKMGISREQLGAYFGSKSVFRDAGHLIDLTVERYPSAFKRVIDRRFFTEERRKAMVDAVRKANDIVVFKLAENQDLKNFQAVREVARALNAPILVAPAFSEIGLIPTKADWLFNEPNVHFMVDRGLQLTQDFYVVDHGYEDKRQNPFAGLAQVYEPTDRVVLFHPRVRAETRPTANNASRPGYMVTTGSMSDPAYWGKFAISMSTDERAQLEAEKNRSILVLSRRYRSEMFGSLLGSANGIAPRRLRYTDARYGNPEGLFDLCKIYSDTGVTEIKSLPAMVLGDIHLGNTDPLFLKGVRETLEYLHMIEKNPNWGKPMEQAYRQGRVTLGAIVLHDLIEGSPNNRHNMDSLLTRAINDNKGALDLADHIQMAAAWIKQLTQLLPNTAVIVPVDNHGSDWLVKRLQEADLFKGGRPREVPLILRLMLDAIEDHANPYERVFQYYGIDTDQVLFMDKKDSYRVGIDLQNPAAFRMVHGTEVGVHSHMGVNGAKSISIAKLLVSYGPNVTGHAHTTAEYGQSAKVGTGTPVRQDWHRGPSNSDASIALVYSETAHQLLRFERGTFVPNAADQADLEFFPGSEYPRVLIRKMPPGGPTTDQFRDNPPASRQARTR